MSLANSRNQECIEEFLRKSLLGEELINTQFHLFSARPVSSSRLTKPRVLCANNVLLARSSKYFLDLLSSDINSDPSLSDLTDVNDIPSNVQIDDYGYESDSDLDDDDGEPPIPIANIESPKIQSTMASTSLPQISVATQPKDDDELSEDGSESVSSDIFVMSPEHPPIQMPSIVNFGIVGSVTSSEAAVQETRDNKTTTSHASLRMRGLGIRHVLVKDTAFQTWYTLLNYLYTGNINFLPLSSVAPGGKPRGSSTSSLDVPRCSAKSMYRLACKVGLDHLRDEALAHIRNNLTEQNILNELSCSLASRHSQLLEMELDVLYAHIASPPVVTGFPALAQRIANRELSHGADIIVGIHARFLGGPRPFPLTPMPPLPPCPSSPSPSPRVPLRSSFDFYMPPKQVARELSDTMKDEIGPFPMDKCDDTFVCQWPKQPLESTDSVFGAECPVPEDSEEEFKASKKKRPSANIAAKKKKR